MPSALRVAGTNYFTYVHTESLESDRSGEIKIITGFTNIVPESVLVSASMVHFVGYGGANYQIEVGDPRIDSDGSGGATLTIPWSSHTDGDNNGQHMNTIEELVFSGSFSGWTRA